MIPSTIIILLYPHPLPVLQLSIAALKTLAAFLQRSPGFFIWLKRLAKCPSSGAVRGIAYFIVKQHEFIFWIKDACTYWKEGSPGCALMGSLHTTYGYFTDEVCSMSVGQAELCSPLQASKTGSEAWASSREKILTVLVSVTDMRKTPKREQEVLKMCLISYLFYLHERVRILKHKLR